MFFKNIELKLLQIRNKFTDTKIIWGGDFNSVHNGIMDRWPSKHDVNAEISNVCFRLGLIDIWRRKNPNQIMYTWSNKDQSKQSRIDYFLISDTLEDSVQSVSIEPSVLTDHKGITIDINEHGSSKFKTNRGYWKLNKTLLENETFNLKVIEIIDRYWAQAKVMNTFGKYWELTKYEIRNLAISIGKTLASAKRQKECKIIKEIMELSCKGTLNSKELLKLSSLQVDLDTIYEEKARGAFTRSRQMWLEQGENRDVLIT